MQPARLCIGKCKPAGKNTQTKRGDWKAEEEEGQQPRHKGEHSIQLSRMLWEQALLRTLQAQCHKNSELLSVIQVTSACDEAGDNP